MNTDIIAFGRGYGAIAVMLVVTAALLAAMLIISMLLGPGHKGPEKGSPYESGVNPVGTARKPFHGRFYLIGLLFLLFDVELIFFYPWAVLFHDNRSGFYLIEMAVFTAILLVAFIYAWAKGVFDWR